MVKESNLTLSLQLLGVITGVCCPLSSVLGKDRVVMGQNHTCCARTSRYFGQLGL